MQEHPGETVLDLVIMALVLQDLETLEGGGEVTGGLALIWFTSNAVTAELSQFPGGVGKSICRRLLIELKRFGIVLPYTQAVMVQFCEGVLRVSVVLFR